MSIGMQILVSSLTVAASLITTAIINHFISIPKRFKAQKEEEKNEIISKIEELGDRLDETDKKQELYRKELSVNMDLLKRGMQATLKNELKIRYENWLKKGYAPMDAKDDLERMYQIYHGLGKNGVLTKLHDQFMDLPLEKKPHKQPKEVV